MHPRFSSSTARCLLHRHESEVIDFLKREDAEVVVGGSSHSKALKKAKAAVAANPKA